MSGIIEFFKHYHLIEIGFLGALLLVFRHYLVFKFVPFIIRKSSLPINKRGVYNYINTLIILYLVYSILRYPEFDIVLFSNSGHHDFTVSDVLLGFFVVELAFFVNYIVQHLLYMRQKDSSQSRERLEKDYKSTGTQSFKSFLIVIALKFIVTIFDLNYTIFSNDKLAIHVNDVLKIILIVLLANFVSFLFIRVFLQSYYQRRKINIGKQYAINQLVKYIIYLIMLLVGIESIGINLNVVWGGLAALMVGIGLGLQTTFADFLSGIIMLFERSIEVGDTIQIGDKVGMVKNIGIRGSKVQLRDHVSMMVPNSKMINSILLNWDGDYELTRFSVRVGVAYGSDVHQVKSILLRIAEKNNYVEKRPAPSVRFIDFGDSSLVFDLIFWSRIMLTIEDIKSDLRFEIYEAFKVNGIQIPFPQRDVWLRSLPSKKE